MSRLYTCKRTKKESRAVFQAKTQANFFLYRIGSQYSEIYNERVTNYKREKKKTEQLLTALLPRSIIHQLKRGQVRPRDFGFWFLQWSFTPFLPLFQVPTPQTFHSVSILLCDIVGFTQLAADSTAHQVLKYIVHK